MAELSTVLAQWSGPLTALVVALGIIVLIVLTLAAQFFSLWLQAYMSRAGVSLGELIGMRLRKVDMRSMVLNKIRAVRAGLDMSTVEMENHYLSGGRVPNVVTALIVANRAAINLNWKTATAIDLAGRDILDALQTSVNPKVIDCPGTDPVRGTDKIDAVAKDGIRLLSKARVTVRANIARLVGGATQETVIARVGQAIVSSIGSTSTYKEVLENPDHISRKALDAGLDAGTAFEILSIDIADISVAGVETEANVGAKLQAEQAEADLRRFQAEAEKRRALAVAREQEMKAVVQENRAKVVLAEAEVPLAIAESFRSGNLGIMA
ncbi:MAG: flotillin-like protein FloA [Phycisphaerae bacterium]|nr:flotillin-like protein FloA [Phycisphaerae bacterium]